jgi:hypothetical protein
MTAERLPLPERPITMSRQAFIEALKTTPRPEELDRTELDDLLEMYRGPARRHCRARGRSASGGGAPNIK